jgi:acyl-coenzyme A synthetase/AMP-(fatty) acid ligase
MFLDLDQKDKSSIAAVDDRGGLISYGELVAFSKKFSDAIGKRTLIFILSENTIGSLAGYVAAISSRIVPLILSSNIDRELLARLIEVYHPEFLWLPESLTCNFNYESIFHKYEFSLQKTGFSEFAMNEDLSLLLTTSGSTGSPKLVRHSYSNLEQNARNVATFFELNELERPVAILPMQYTMGLSVVTSHLYAGSSILLMSSILTDTKFWKFIKEQKASSFTGVPYSYEVLHKLRFLRMDLPHLKLLTQGGGKLREELFREFAEFAEKTGKKFIATYGQTEGTARMAYLPAEMATKKTGSIGGPIPNGQLSIIDSAGIEIHEMEATGQMIYKGPNVTLGYAYNAEDLIKGDENQGVLFTGDIARRDADGYYFIVGRMSRFLKLYGLRISLDESEQIIKSTFNVDCVCSGNDEKMKVYINDGNKTAAVKSFLSEKTGLFYHAIEVIAVTEIPKNEFGKPFFKQV